MLSAVVEGGDARKDFALEEFEGRSTTGRHVAHGQFEPGLGYRGRRVTTADYRHGATFGGAGHSLGDRTCSLVKRGRLENTHRSVPEHRLRRCYGAAERCHAVGANVEHRRVRGNGVAVNDPRGLRLFQAV